MKIVLLVVGRTVETWLKNGIDDYVSRLGHFVPFEMQVIPELKNTKSMDTLTQKQKEGELILKSFQAGDHIVLLDDKGAHYTSEEKEKVEEFEYLIVENLLRDTYFRLRNLKLQIANYQDYSDVITSFANFGNIDNLSPNLIKSYFYDITTEQFDDDCQYLLQFERNRDKLK